MESAAYAEEGAVGPIYGSVAYSKDPSFTSKASKPRSSLWSTGLPMCVNLVIPWLLFIVVYAAMTFSLRYWSPGVSWLIFFAAAAITLVTGALACYMAVLRRPSAPPPTSHPAWVCLLFFLLVIALALGTVLGDLNYRQHLLPYYDTMSLNTYTNVDPLTQQSHQMMDAGQMVFLPEFRPDPLRSMGFRSRDMYCVTPIVSSNKSVTPSSSNYDYWAVGLNCCSGDSHDFHCGEYNNPVAHSGLRVVDEYKQPFYRLAVQQAEAAYNIKAPHPILLMWLADPLVELNAMHDVGIQYFYTGLYSHLIFQVVVVFIALLVLTKLGWQMTGGSLKPIAMHVN